MRFRNPLPQRGSYDVIVSGDSPPPLQATLPLVDYDTPDNARLGKITPSAPTTPTTPTTPMTPMTMKLLNSESDTETIENAVPIGQTVLPVPEPRPKIERNGTDADAKKPVTQREDDSCVVDCIYYTQQCCECVIL